MSSALALGGREAVADAVPRGFRRVAGSRLVVTAATLREREVWTRDEWRQVNRAVAFLRSKRVSLRLVCRHPGCSDLEMVEDTGGDPMLRCDHLDRVFRREA